MLVRLVFILVTLLSAPLSARGALQWHGQAGRVDATIDGQPLAAVLATIAADTGWRVYVEPHTQRAVVARFHGLPTTDALRRVLDGLSFALLPQPVGPSALYVFRGTAADATERVAAARPGEGALAGGTTTNGDRIVVLKPGHMGSIAALARRLGATIVGQIDGLGAYRLRFAGESRGCQVVSRKQRGDLAHTDGAHHRQFGIERAGEERRHLGNRTAVEHGGLGASIPASRDHEGTLLDQQDPEPATSELVGKHRA